MKNVFKYSLTIAFILVVSLLEAQPPGGGSPPPGGSPTCWPPPCIPIDGGISFLLLAGAAFGAKKIYDQRKPQV